MRPMYVAGSWVESADSIPVTSPHSGDVIDVVPSASAEQADAALEAAVQGAAAMRSLPAHERVAILRRAADLIETRAEAVAQQISAEVGKPITEARTETVRSAEILRLSAFEGTQLRSETLPLDAHPAASGKLGFTLRIPCGVVVAISPFNYPLMLVVHKVGPALAAGNATVLKPATQTPLTALTLTEILLEAGLPELGLQCLTGPGQTLGAALCADPRVRKITFTGSTTVGEAIARVAGIKRVSLELGANCPMIVLPDADLHVAAQAAAVAGTVNAGQVCISLQRILVQQDVYEEFVDALAEPFAGTRMGDPHAEDTALGPMISPQEAERVATYVNEAADGGARVVTGGRPEGAYFLPTVVADVSPTMRMATEELFGPAVGVTPVADIHEAIALANDSRYGLAASIFTRDIGDAMRFARAAEAGNVHINWTPLWRADLMPYGGLKGSGLGKEGPRYAVEEMTESKTVVVHGLD
jgi:acyl-CoA reductase-like NAD-dependent aldehyde dehydrogenase